MVAVPGWAVFIVDVEWTVSAIPSWVKRTPRLSCQGVPSCQTTGLLPLTLSDAVVVELVVPRRLYLPLAWVSRLALQSSLHALLQLL
jgi:hypothetical protein